MALRLLLAIVVIAAIPPHASADDRDAARREAERRAKVAHETKDFAAYVACGNSYLELHNRASGAPGGDELLYNAAVCFREGKSIAPAVRLFEQVFRQYPNSKLAPRAMGSAAVLYGDIVQLDRAAALLERYAKTYAGEKDAYDAMSDAIFYYRALGDREKWIALTRSFVKIFQMKRPGAAAAALFSLAGAYADDPESEQKLLAEYLRQFTNDREQTILAHVRLGELAWAKACPVRMTDGLCVKAVRTRGRAPDRCTTTQAGPVLAWAAVPRDPKQVKVAVAHYTAALKLYVQRAHDPARADVAYAAAMADLTLTDVHLEALLASRPPTNGSLKALTVWIDDQKRTASSAIEKYTDVIAHRDPGSGLQALQRVARTNEAVWTALATIAPPKAQREAFCSTVRDAADPLHAEAVDAYGRCTARATELMFYSPAATACHRALETLAPAEFPPLIERIASPLAVGVVLAVEPPLKAR